MKVNHCDPVLIYGMFEQTCHAQKWDKNTGNTNKIGWQIKHNVHNAWQLNELVNYCQSFNDQSFFWHENQTSANMSANGM